MNRRYGPPGFRCKRIADGKQLVILNVEKQVGENKEREEAIKRFAESVQPFRLVDMLQDENAFYVLVVLSKFFEQQAKYPYKVSNE